MTEAYSQWIRDAMDLVNEYADAYADAREDGCDMPSAEARRVRAALRAHLEAMPMVYSPTCDARVMFVSRLENMQKNCDTLVTVQAVLALLNDCDMLAARRVPDALLGETCGDFRAKIRLGLT